MGKLKEAKAKAEPKNVVENLCEKIITVTFGKGKKVVLTPAENKVDDATFKALKEDSYTGKLVEAKLLKLG